MELAITNLARDLGVIMDSALTSELHGSEVANSALGIIREGTENKTASL